MQDLWNFIIPQAGLQRERRKKQRMSGLILIQMLGIWVIVDCRLQVTKSNST